MKHFRRSDPHDVAVEGRRFSISHADGRRDIVDDLDKYIEDNNLKRAGRIRDARRHPDTLDLPILSGFAGPIMRGDKLFHYYVPREKRT
jgi:hypothetical protein